MIDYCKLNSISKKDRYPLPRIDDTLDKMHGAQYFSAMDLISGYWQIPMDEENQQKCAFITSEGLYQPIRMPQGLANAPATFQRLMDNTFRTLKNTCVLVYLDNINVYSKSFDSHLKDLCKVFTRLGEIGLKLKPKKCSFFLKRTRIFGTYCVLRWSKTASSKIRSYSKNAPTNKCHQTTEFSRTYWLLP